MKNTILKGSIVLSLLFSVHCGTPIPFDSALSSATIQGVAMLGPVSGATVTAYAVNSDGTLNTETAIATTTTDSSGGYSLTISPQSLPKGPLALQLQGGSYTDEATATVVTLSSVTYTTILPTVNAGSTLAATLGPLPDMAYQKFQALVQTGGISSLDEAATDAIYLVSQAFGIPDVVGTLPSNPFQTIPRHSSGQYAMTLAAFSYLAQNAGTDSTALTASFTKQLLQDGNFSTPTAVTVSTASGASATITPPSFSELTAAIDSISSGAVTLPGVTAPAHFPAPTLNSVPSTSAVSGFHPGEPASPVTPAATSTENSVDWRTAGAVTSVKNQGGCTGIGWAFAATAALEGLNFIKNGVLRNFSQQQLLDCNTENQACSGGSLTKAFQYTVDNGIELGAAYPYTATHGTCHYNGAQVNYNHTGYQEIFPNNEAALIAAVTLGPVAATIQADQAVFQNYTGGIIKDAACGTTANHSVLIVGFTPTYWIVKNSYGTIWGESGYARIAMSGDGPGICGIQAGPVLPTE